MNEYEYLFDFASADNDYIAKLEFTRGTNKKTAVYITGWGLAQMSLSNSNVNGVFTQSNDAVANGSYIDVIHGQNTYDLIATGWVFELC
jgi:hypothetical protein